MKSFRTLFSLVLVNVLATFCFAPAYPQPALKDAFQGKFMVGAALGGFRIMGFDTTAAVLVEQHFNTVTPENSMKWERIHPEPGKYRFKVADRMVEQGEKNGMHLLAHTLVWHKQTPEWVFLDQHGNLTTRDTLLMRMRDHIQTIMGRYRGKIDTWDVVNEAINDDGTLRESLWYKIIGEDYIEKAFRYAMEADPDAQLIYNDFSLANRAKRAGTIKLIKHLQQKGIRVDGVGMQAHYDLEDPALKEVEKSIIAFSQLGVQVMITELDVSVLPPPDNQPGAEVTGRFEYRPELDPYINGLPDSVQHLLAERYAGLFSIFVKHSDKISRVTFWGVDDGASWKNNDPVRGRTDYALLFDRNFQPKPAFHSVIQTSSRE